MHFFGITFVFLNTPSTCSIKRALSTPTNPRSSCAVSSAGEHGRLPYGDRSKHQRRIINNAIGAQQIPSYHPLILTQTHVFLRRLIASPADFISISRTYAGSLTLAVVYGYNPVSPTDDPFLNLAEECVGLLSNRIASGGGIWLVDDFPSLKNLPSWAPFSGFL